MKKKVLATFFMIGLLIVGSLLNASERRQRRITQVPHQTKEEKEKIMKELASGWKAYFDIDGRYILVKEPISKIKEDYWWYIKYTDYKGPKSRIAITGIQNKVEGDSKTIVPVGAILEMIVKAFIDTHRYTVVERKKLDTVLKEQDLGKSGRISKPSAAKIGKLLGAQYIVEAAVIEYEPKAGGFGAAGGGYKKGGLGGIFGIKRNRAEVRMNFRVIDATTGEIVDSVTTMGWAAEWGLGGGGLGFGNKGGGGLLAGGYTKTPIGKAVQSAIAKAVYQIVMKLKDNVWEGKVVLVRGKKVYINAGENLGIKEGMVLFVLKPGEKLIDPDTGLELGEETTPVGKIKITQVKSKYSIGIIENTSEPIKKGYIVSYKER